MKRRDLLNLCLALFLSALAPATGASAESSLSRLEIHAGLTDEERESLKNVLSGQPSIDLSIQFRAGSAVISPDLLPMLNALGKALTSPELKGRTLMIIGYADATRHAGQIALATRRAEAVKRYLVANYPLDPANLVTAAVEKKAGDPCCIRVVSLDDKPAEQAAPQK